jgi:hypothetical protein
MAAPSNFPSAAATNRLGIRYLTTGPAGVRRRFNELIRALDYLYPNSTADIVTEITPQGALPRFRVPGGLSSTRATIHPFQLFAVAGAAKIIAANGSVVGGGVNAIPTIGGTSIATTPAPELTVVTGTVYLHATVDAAGAITALVIENAASTPADTTTEKYRTITSVTVTGTTVTLVAPQDVQTSLNLFLCGSAAIWERA